MEPPVEPKDSDCCNSGCNPCIFDVYEMQLKKYQERMSCNSLRKTNITKNCLDLLSYSIFELIKCTAHAHNVFIYTFKYKRRLDGSQTVDSDTRELSVFFKPGQHLLIRALHPITNNYFTRAYTPLCIKEAENEGHLTFKVMIKLYEDGTMSNIIKNLAVNAETHWRGPYGNFRINYNFRNILCVAQGTGIAPYHSIFEEMLTNDDCETFIKLLYCCRNGHEILLRDELQRFATYWNFTYEIYLTQREPKFVPRFNEIVHDIKLPQRHLIDYLKDLQIESVQILICGNPDFNEILRDYLKEINLRNEQVYLL